LLKPNSILAPFLLFITLVLTVPEAIAHGGGLNKEGCHNNRKTVDYHCHRGPKAPSKQQTLTGLPKITDGDTIRIGKGMWRGEFMMPWEWRRSR
jgi:hypothetical protein